MSRLTLPTPWTPLSDAAWDALQPYLPPLAPQGRRVADRRARLDAVFHLAHQPGAPWKALPERHGRPDTVSRFFRRLTHAGFWHALLRALAKAPPRHPLKSLEYAICRACRRAARLGGLPLLVLIRRLGLRAALAAPPWLLPDPLLSETLRRLPPLEAAPADLARSRLWLERAALGRARIPRAVRLAWS